MFKTLKTIIAAVALSGTVGANVQAEEITVHKGDTLWGLSQVHNASVENIKGWNHLVSDIIHPGDILKIATKKHYIVKKEDTLFSIAIENHVSVQSLIEWNDLYTNLIHPGLNLVLYDDSIAPGKMAPVNQAETESTKKVQTNSVPAVPQITKASKSAANGSVVNKPIVDDAQQLENIPSSVEPVPAAVQAPVVEQTSAPAPAAEPAPEPAPTVQPPAPPVAPEDPAKEITVKATAYTASCEGCSGITKTGVNLKTNPDEKVIAVDPSVIPLGSKVYIEGYGEATAADTGGAIKGNRIDVYMKNQSDAIEFGAKEMTVKIIN